MIHRLGFTFFFFLTFAIQARMVNIPLSKTHYYALAASWILLTCTRKTAIKREVKLLRKEINKRIAARKAG